MKVIQQPDLAELIAGCGTGISRSGEGDVVRLSELPGLIAESARSAAEHGGSASGVKKTPWPFWWQSPTVRAPASEVAAITSSGTASGITGQRAGAAGGELKGGIWEWGIEE
jgi:hypothetical protein